MLSLLPIDAHYESAAGLEALIDSSIHYNIVIGYDADLSIFLVAFHFYSVELVYFNNQQILSLSNLQIPQVYCLHVFLNNNWPAALGLLLLDGLYWFVMGIRDEIDHLVLEGKGVELGCLSAELCLFAFEDFLLFGC